MNKNDLNSVERFSWQYKIAEYFSYLSLVFVPLVISSNYLFPTNIPKIITMTFLSTAILFFYLWGNWSKKISIKFSFLGVVVSLFVLILTISSLFGVDPTNSFWGWRNVTPLISIYTLLIFSFVVGSLIKKNKRIILKLLSASFITSIIVMIIFYLDLRGVELADGSTLGNSSYLGTYLLFNLFFGICLFLYSKKMWLKAILFLGIGFILINPLFINKDVLLLNISFSNILKNPLSLLGIANGATLGVLVSSIFTVLFFLFLSNKKIKKIIGVILLVAVILGGITISNELVTKNTSLNRVFVEKKTENRFIAWDIAKKGYLDKPVLGNGYNNFIYNFDKYYNPKIYEKSGTVERFFKPHNVFWEVVSETGLVGIFVYLLLLLSLLFTFLIPKGGEYDSNNKNFLKLRVLLASLLLGYFVQNLFVFDTITSYLLLFLLVAIGLGFSNYQEFKINSKFDNIKKYSTFLLMIFCLCSLYFFVIVPSAESKKSDNLTPKIFFGGIMNDTYYIDNLLSLYQKNLHKINENNKESYLENLKTMFLILEQDTKKQKYYSESYLLMSQILNYYLMVDMKEGDKVRFNGTNYDKEIWLKSHESILMSLDLNPNNPKAYLVLSELYILKADFKNAILYDKKALQIAPEYKEAYAFGNKILKLFPDSEFDNYLKSTANSQ